MEKERARRIWRFRGAMLLLAIALIGIGAARGEVQIVLKKAVRICLECIGVAG